MNMTNEELRAIASPFRSDYAGDLSRLHVSQGVIVATDGRCLIHIENPAITPLDGDKPPRTEYISNKFDDEPPATIAGPRQIEKLAATLVPVYEEAVREIEKRAAEFDAETEARRQFLSICDCPHCGGRLVIDNGEAVSIEEWAEQNRPDEIDIEGFAVLSAEGLEDEITLGLRYFGKALATARKLGGAERLEVCKYPVVALRGQGWFIAIARLRNEHQNGGPAVKIRLEKEVANV